MHFLHKMPLSKKKCSPIFNSSWTCAGCHRCFKNDVGCTFAYPNSEHTAFSSHQSPKESSVSTGLRSFSSILLPAQRGIVETLVGNGEADKSGLDTFLPLFTIMCPNYDMINEDEFEGRETDRSGHATPLPPHSYSPKEMFNNEDEFDYEEAGRSSQATLLPPNLYSHYNLIHSFRNLSEHSTFGFSHHVMKNHLEYTIQNHNFDTHMFSHTDTCVSIVLTCM